MILVDTNHREIPIFERKNSFCIASLLSGNQELVLAEDFKNNLFLMEYEGNVLLFELAEEYSAEQLSFVIQNALERQHIRMSRSAVHALCEYLTMQEQMRYVAEQISYVGKLQMNPELQNEWMQNFVQSIQKQFVSQVSNTTSIPESSILHYFTSFYHTHFT